MSSYLNVNDLNQSCKEVLRVASYTDHNDYGLERCQQETVLIFFRCLSALGLNDNSNNRLEQIAAKCCFHNGEMNASSNKALKIAKAFAIFWPEKREKALEVLEEALAEND